MSALRKQQTEDSDWREELVRMQIEHPPKKRHETYYYSDGIPGSCQMWVKHSPGMNIPMRVNKVWPDGIRPDEEYDSSLQMNIGSEEIAWRLYKALEAYFNDQRSQPWFLQDVEVDDE